MEYSWCTFQTIVASPSGLTTSFNLYWYAQNYLRQYYPALGRNSTIKEYHARLTQFTEQTKQINRRNFNNIKTDVVGKSTEIYEVFRSSGVQVFQEIRQKLSSNLVKCMKTFEGKFETMITNTVSAIKKCADAEQNYAKTYQTFVTSRINTINQFMLNLTKSLNGCYRSSYRASESCTVGSVSFLNRGS